MTDSLTMIVGHIPISQQLADDLAAIRDAERGTPHHGPWPHELAPGHRLLLELHPGHATGPYRRS